MTEIEKEFKKEYGTFKTYEVNAKGIEHATCNYMTHIWSEIEGEFIPGLRLADATRIIVSEKPHYFEIEKFKLNN